MKKNNWFIVILTFAIIISLDSFHTINIRAYDDLNGDGVIDKEEKDAFAQKIGYSTNKEMVEASMILKKYDRQLNDLKNNFKIIAQPIKKILLHTLIPTQLL